MVSCNAPESPASTLKRRCHVYLNDREPKTAPTLFNDYYGRLKAEPQPKTLLAFIATKQKTTLSFRR